MSKPLCYSPENGFKFQIVCRNSAYGRAWEHCDYATDKAQRIYLVGEYRLAYAAGWEFRAIVLPRRCWPSHVQVADDSMNTVLS